NLLWYNVFGTNDAISKLHGNPYDNTRRWYSGSGDDHLLNRSVQRFAANPVAVAALARYQTTGHLTIPLVTLHTTGDEIIPFWHEFLYFAKVRTSGGGSFTPIPTGVYGHCSFTTADVLVAFITLVGQVNGRSVSATAAQYHLEQVERDLAMLSDRR